MSSVTDFLTGFDFSPDKTIYYALDFICNNCSSRNVKPDPNHNSGARARAVVEAHPDMQSPARPSNSPNSRSRCGILSAINATDGALLWKLKTGDTFGWSVGVNPDGTTIYVAGTDDKSFVAVNAKNGTIMWKFNLGPKLPLGLFELAQTAVCSADGTVVYAGTCHSFSAIEGPNGPPSPPPPPPPSPSPSPSPSPPPSPPPPPPPPGRHVCADPGSTPPCNVCSACCHSYIPSGKACNACEQEKCRPSPSPSPPPPPPSPYYACNQKNWTCHISLYGYSSPELCENGCRNPTNPYFACNQKTWTCRPSAHGYNTSASCEKGCKTL